MSTTNTPKAPPPTHIQILTPSRRAISAEPSNTSRSLRRQSILRTPGSTARTPGAVGGLSASGRKPAGGNAAAAATPHGRAAIRALDSRRAAIFTPRRDARRRSLRDLQRETPRDHLRGLSRLLAPRTEPVPSSSSPGDGTVKSEINSEPGGRGFLDEEEDDGPLRVPRLSLPIDLDEDEDDPRPHRSAGLEDDNFTMQSIEMPRRAVSEQPRLSMAGAGRTSDVYGYERSDEVGIDSAFFPPLHAMDEDAAAGMVTEEVFEFEAFEAEDARWATGRESDFGLVLPDVVEGNESTFVINAEAREESPVQEDEHFEIGEASHVHFAPDVVGGDEGEEENAGQLEEEIDAEAEESGVEIEAAEAKDGAAAAKMRKKKKKGVKMSRHGIPYPSLPTAVVKRLAQTFAKTSGVKGKINPDALNEIMQASDWFFEQVGGDLQAYANHAGRKTIDESDMLQLMRRQRLINSSTTPFSLAQRYLPRELLQELRMPAPVPVKKSRGAKSRAGNAGDDVT